jgi:hypothetical protein
MIRQTARRILVATTLILGASATLSPLAFAASENGGDQQGEMPAQETVAYTPATKFNFTAGTDMIGQSFGQVNVFSNSNAGWLLEVKSLQGGKLQHTTIGTANIGYALSVDGVAATVSTPDTYGNAKDVNTLTCAAVGGCNYNVTADILGVDSDGKPTGTYQDTITFRLTNK